VKYSGVLDVQNVQVIPFMIENGGSKRISESQVLPGLQISLLIEALRKRIDHTARVSTCSGTYGPPPAWQ
jgi:hypothetical protein